MLQSLQRTLVDLRGPFVAVLLTTLAASAAAQPVVIDTFETDQTLLQLTFPPAGTTASNLASGPGILGTERDLSINLTAGVVNNRSLTAEVNSDVFSYGQDPTLTGGTMVVWDGADGNATTLNPTGLGGVDLTGGGSQNAFLMRVTFDDVPVPVQLTIYTNGANASRATVNLPGLIFANTEFVIPYSSFTPLLGAGADFTNVGAVTLGLSASNAPDFVLDFASTTSLVTATKTVAISNDVDGDGAADPGDTLTYTIVIANPDDAFDAAEAGVQFANPVPLNTIYVPGSLTTTQGTPTAAPPNLSVDVGTIPDGGSVTITFQVTINNPLPAGVTQITCQGTVTSPTIPNLPTDDPGAPGTEDPTIIPVTAAPAVSATKVDSLAVDADGDGLVDPGDGVKYTVVISNTGNQNAANVVFTSGTDPNTSLVVGSVMCSQGTVTSGNAAGNTTVAVDLGTIAGAGGTATCMFQVTYSPTGPGVTQIACQGTVTGANFPTVPTDDPDTPAPLDPTFTPVQPVPVLTATKAVMLLGDVNGNGQADPGDTLKYTVVVTNTGSAPAAGVVFTSGIPAFTDLIPAGTMTTQGTITSGSSAGDTQIVVAIGTLAPAAAATIMFQVQIENPLPANVTQISCQGSVTATNFPGTMTDNPDTPTPGDPTIIPVRSAPALTASKTVALFTDVDGDGQVDPGDTLQYTVVISNSGNAGATGVQFTSGVPTGTSLVPNMVTTTQGTVTNGNGGADTGVAVDVGTIAPAGSVTITFKVQLANPLPAGQTQIVCQGTVSGTNFPSLPTDDPTTPVPGDPTTIPIGTAPILQASKVANLFTDVNGDGLAGPGDVLQYTVVISNSGNAAATGVSFTSGIPANTGLVVNMVTTTQGTVTSGNGAGDTNVTVSLGTILPDGSATITFKVQIDDPLPAGVTQITCQGTVTGGNFPPVLTDDPATPASPTPTVTPVIPSGTQENPIEVPTLGFWGLLLLTGVLAATGLWRLRRRMA